MTSNYKGMAIQYGREQLQSRGIEREFLKRLNPADRDAYEKTFLISWIDVDLGARLIEAMAAVLTPGSPKATFEFGRNMAKDNLNRFLKFIMRFLSIDTAIEKTAALWGAYHRVGVPSSQRQGSNMVEFAVKDYPDLPKVIRQTTAGYIAELVTLTGVQNVNVRVDETDPSCWRWIITWR